ncbi:modulator of FtsH protease [Halospina denitrificans]|uniref:Modulator of FtsH protease n=1 Tax=Halospina denitrificans TaxID=332522 RepID=A0A4R7JVJ5_9GAMM|nr:Bax inhibitor-1/YccA family protein [Halospina denitrificans]TDT41507.1 modulator of FtsH protease [Halospina denitrificans]
MDNNRFPGTAQAQTQGGTASQGLSLEVVKVLRNTYTLLAMTLAFSAVMAGISTAMEMPFGVSLVCFLVSLGLIWFVLPKTANSSAGIWVVFAFTGLLGFGLGPTLNHYLSMSNGGSIIMQALGATAIVFLGLSGYVLTTKKDFSFLRGMLMAGLLVAVVGVVGVLVLSMFGVDVSAVSLALSGMISLLMAGFILYDTSRIINGGETNYILATTALYLNIYNLFVNLLHLIGAFTGDG